MKRGKDEEKSMGPMFPRLHVNDTDKGGPRAPPRNKMALYEQLSIPSQRFSGGVMPHNPNSTVSHVPPPSSSSHGGANERGSVFPLQQPPSTNDADKLSNRYSDLNNQLVQNEHKKKQEEDDFRVPIFVHNQNGDKEGPSPFVSGFSGHGTNVQNATERNSSRGQLKETNGSSSGGHKNASNNSIRLLSNVNLQDQVVDSRADNISGSNEAMRAVGYGHYSMNVRDIQQEVLRSPNEPTNGDAISENSMVDSISRVDISPDDVVGIIGQKQFWKARRAIVNQQRVFSVQVFELHRLIKVQRLIAGSPQLMVEDDSFLAKPAKVSPIKKIPLEYVLKSSPNVPKLKDYSQKPAENTREFTAENAVKASFSSVQNSGQTMFSGYPLPPVGSLGLSQPTPGGAHQWLIPVMTPSEGLVYKVYPGPGYMSPGGPGPPVPASVIGHNFVNYGVPSPPPPPHYQWPGSFHPLVPPAAQGYFPPYSKPPVNPSGGEPPNPFTTQHEGSVGDVPIVANFHASNENEVQVSTASSPNDKARDQNALPLFPTRPPAAEGAGPPRTHVIRVVPHNARLATESVARIFQSIQEERKHHDPI